MTTMPAPPASRTVRVAVQSSRRLLRDTLSASLGTRQDLTVVGKVAELDAVPALCQLRRPDAVILDAGSGLGDVSLLARDLTHRFPEVKVILTYQTATRQELAAACQAGVAALVPESHGFTALLPLLRRQQGRPARASSGGLTDRELEVVVLTASGHSVSEMAALLDISPLTIQNLKRRVFAKLDVSSSPQAVARAASLGILDREASPSVRTRTCDSENSAPLTVVCGRPGAVIEQIAAMLIASQLPLVLVSKPGPAADSHWARWHRGPIVAVLVDPAPPDWAMVTDLGVPAVLVHSGPADSPELAGALACGASAMLPAGRVGDHLLPVVRMVSQGYLVVGSTPMRALIGAAHARRDDGRAGRTGLPELTARESDILRGLARGCSIRQTARLLGIAPKTVENVQTHLFRKLGVRNRAGAFAVADAFGLLPRIAPPSAAGHAAPSSPRGYSSVTGQHGRS
jgi:DNA-binding NarL/FixJ family response regulator